MSKEEDPLVYEIHFEGHPERSVPTRGPDGNLWMFSPRLSDFARVTVRETPDSPLVEVWRAR